MNILSKSNCTLILVSLIAMHTSFVYAVDDSIAVKDNAKKETIKKGWNFGVLPAISFSSDLGFQYGGLVNAYNYCDGSRSPKYNHSLYVEISTTTKGNGVNRIFYDSDKLIRKCRFSVDATYFDDKALQFYGFNGIQSFYNSNFIDSKNADYKTRMFYGYSRKMLRFEPVLSGKLYNKVKWIAGIGIYNFNNATVDIAKLNKGQTDANKLPNVPGLYDKYVSWGLFSADEQKGGWFNHAIVGLAYDTRDNEVNTSHGLCDEVLVGLAPTFFGNKTNSAKITLVHRQFLTLIDKKLTFCYRLSWQSNQGSMPWYAKQLLLKSFPSGDYSEGVGGSKNVRGILRYRLLGNDVAYGNFEFRYMFAHSRIMNQNFHLGLNTFYDAGIVTRFIPIDMSKVPQSEVNNYFTTASKDKLHQSIGLGFRVIMNQNFVVAFEYGHALQKQDGVSGFYINLNYLF